MCFRDEVIVCILLISVLNVFNDFTEAISLHPKLLKDVDSFSKKKSQNSHPKQKNEISDALGSRRVCMNVCNPPYYNQEIPPSYSNQYNPGGGQYYPVSGQFNPGGWSQNIPGGYENQQDNSQSLIGPSDGYQNQNFGENQFYPDGSFGDYISGCYRNMFRRKYRFDPGFVKPTIFNYRTLLKRNHEGFKRGRNFRNNNQDFMNCQLICYPVMMPSYMPSSTPPTTPSESTETTEENTSTTKKPSQKTTANKSKKSKRHKGQIDA